MDLTKRLLGFKDRRLRKLPGKQALVDHIHQELDKCASFQEYTDLLESLMDEIKFKQKTSHQKRFA